MVGLDSSHLSYSPAYFVFLCFVEQISMAVFYIFVLSFVCFFTLGRAGISQVYERKVSTWVWDHLLSRFLNSVIDFSQTSFISTRMSGIPHSISELDITTHNETLVVSSIMRWELAIHRHLSILPWSYDVSINVCLSSTVFLQVHIMMYSHRNKLILLFVWIVLVLWYLFGFT